MIISDNDREFLLKNVPNAVSFLNGDVNQVLRGIYDFIDMYGFEPPDYEDYNATGRKAQNIYDHIYEDNILSQ